MSAIDLLFPVYINQRVVFDFVATMQDGISTVTRSKTTEGGEVGTKTDIGGSFGLGAAMSNFFKIDAKAGRESKDSKTSHTEEATDKYQTPASLLARLIATLRENGQLTPYEDINKCAVGQLIEFQAILHRNPMVETLQAALQGFEMFMGVQQDAAKNVRGQKNLPTVKQESGVELGLKISKRLLEDMEGDKTADIVSSPLADATRIVVTLEREFLSDPSMTNLVEGEFRVLAKVIRVLPLTSDKLSLLRNSTIGKMQTGIVQGVLDAVQNLKQFVNVSDSPVEVPGPVLHVLPIAIYT